MTRNRFFYFELLILLVLVYLKYFNETVNRFLSNHGLAKAIFAFAIFYFGVKVLAALIKGYYLRKLKLPRDKKNNVHFGIENIANVLLTIGFLGLVVRFFGIDPLELVTSATIVAAAIALVTRDYIADFLSGIYLGFSRTFDVNDYVKILDYKGKIVEIGMLKTEILNDDDDVVIIPNFKVYNSEIINYTKRDPRLVSIDFQMGHKQVSNIEKLERELLEALGPHHASIEHKSYRLKVVDMKMDHLVLKFQYKLVQMDGDAQRRVRKETMRLVFNFVAERAA